MAGTSKLQYRDKVINPCLCPEVPTDESIPHRGRCPMNGKWESIKDSIYSFAQTAVTCVATPLTLLHKRLGHADHDNIVRGINYGHLRGSTIKGSKTITSKCPCCIEGKLTRRSFKSKDYDDILDTRDSKVTKPGERVHMDGVGPIETKALGGYEGCYTFTDEKTKGIWTYLYKNPREVYRIMNEFYDDLKSLYDAKLRCVHTDQAPTHKSSQMTELLEKLNVKMSFSSV